MTTSVHTPPLRRALGALTVLAVLLALLVQAVPARAATDDYPWKTDQSYSNDSFGFQKRQCVSYAAWRLYKEGRRISNRAGGWGDASHWADQARALHRTVSRTPRVGAIAQWNAYERSPYYSGGRVGTMTAGRYGHVAVVTAVYSDHSVLVRQYNMTGTRSYSTMRVKAPRYLYL